MLLLAYLAFSSSEPQEGNVLFFVYLAYSFKHAASANESMLNINGYSCIPLLNLWLQSLLQCAKDESFVSVWRYSADASRRVKTCAGIRNVCPDGKVTLKKPELGKKKNLYLLNWPTVAAHFSYWTYMCISIQICIFRL